MIIINKENLALSVLTFSSKTHIDTYYYDLIHTEASTALEVFNFKQSEIHNGIWQGIYLSGICMNKN